MTASIAPLGRVAPLLALWIATPAAATAIDCATPRTMVVDQLICEYPALRGYDRLIDRRYRQLLAALDPDSANALRADQNRFVGVRDGVMAPPVGRITRKGGAEALTARMKSRSDMLETVVARPAPGLIGTWRNNGGTIRLKPDGKGGLALTGFAVEQRAGRWTCDAGGRGAVHADGSATIPIRTRPGLPAWSIVARRRGATLDVTERASGPGIGSSPFCGANGSLAGRYFRVADED